MSPYRSLQVLAFAGFAGLPGLSVAGELTSMGHAATGPRLERHSVRSLTPDFNALVTPGRTYASLLARRITGTPGSSYRMVRNVGSVLKKAPENSYVLLGDFESGNIYAYQETAGLPLLATYSTGSSSGVGGIAEQEATPKHWVVETDDYIFWIEVAPQGKPQIHFTPVGTMHNSLGSDYYAYGLTIDKSGNSWVGNWPSKRYRRVHEESASVRERLLPCQVLVTATDFSVVYFLAADGDKIYADGFGASDGNPIFCRINTNTGACYNKPFLSFSSSGFFPGGIKFDKRHNLIVNNQFGTLTTYAPPYAVPVATFQYSESSALDYTAIALDPSQKNIWAANVEYCETSNTCGNAMANTYPLNTFGPLGGTPLLTNALPLGVAVI